MSICLIRWQLFSVEFGDFAAFFGFLFVLETAFGFLEAHAGVHLARHCRIYRKLADFQFKEVFEII